MKPILQFRLPLALVLAAASAATAQAFDCGSDGSYGPINITSNTTLNVPSNGVFNCTTITVVGGTLYFNTNALNTPIYLLATGDVVISGNIDVSGAVSSTPPAPGVGAHGGYSGGWGGTFNGPGGDGLGPGGGLSWLDCYSMGAAHAYPIQSNTNTYGNSWLMPLVGGSGGAGTTGNPGSGGGAGGGAILIASNTKITVNGAIYARGGGGGAGGGSGGAIRLVAPVVGGTGQLNVDRGVPNSGCGSGSAGSVGRIRIDCTDNYAYRSLGVLGTPTRGSRMMVFPTVIPRLDIIEAAGQTIPEGSANPVQIELPLGSATNRTVKVQARNFTNDVPIRVLVAPENGPSSRYDVVVLQASGNPPSTNVPVVIPAGTACQIQAWTR